MDKMLGKILRGDFFYSPSKLHSITSLPLGTFLVSGRVYNCGLGTFCFLGEAKASIIIHLKPVWQKYFPGSNIVPLKVSRVKDFRADKIGLTAEQL